MFSFACIFDVSGLQEKFRGRVQKKYPENAPNVCFDVFMLVDQEHNPPFDTRFHQEGTISADSNPVCIFG